MILHLALLFMILEQYWWILMIFLALIALTGLVESWEKLISERRRR